MSAPAGRPQASHTATTLRAATWETDWQLDAACRGLPSAIFYPESTSFAAGRPGNTNAAKQVCRDCPVTTECLAFALRHNENHGVWGGLNPTERRKLCWPALAFVNGGG